MELKVNPIAIPEAITFNFEELKAGLLEKVSVYEAMVYTDEQISAAKADRANLNRLKKALNDERIKQEKDYLRPFNSFKGQINEIIGIIDRPVQMIDKQVKAFEEQQKAEKKQKIGEYWNHVLMAEKVPAGICFRHIFDEKMLNSSVSMKTIQETIDAKLAKMAEDLTVIGSLPAYAFEAEQTYLSTLDLAKAVSEAHRLSEMAKRKAEYEAEKEKRKAEQEAAQQAASTHEPVKDEPKPAHVESAEPQREWIAFQAYLSLEEARELGMYLKSHGIQYKAI